MFLEIHIQNKGHIWKNKGCFWVTWTKISLKNYSMMPIVGLFLAILGFSNVNLRFLAHFHELQRKTSLRMTHKNIKSSLRTISFLEPLKSSYFFGQFKPWRSYKLCSYKKKRVYNDDCPRFLEPLLYEYIYWNWVLNTFNILSFVLFGIYWGVSDTFQKRQWRRNSILKISWKNKSIIKKENEDAFAFRSRWFGHSQKVQVDS